MYHRKNNRRVSFEACMTRPQGRVPISLYRFKASNTTSGPEKQISVYIRQLQFGEYAHCLLLGVFKAQNTQIKPKATKEKKAPTPPSFTSAVLAAALALFQDSGAKTRRKFILHSTNGSKIPGQLNASLDIRRQPTLQNLFESQKRYP